MLNTIILNNMEVNNLLSLKETLEAVKNAYMAYNSNQVVQPSIVSIDVPDYNGEIDIKSGYIRTEDVIGIKVAGGYWNNPKNFGIPSGVALICLLDARNGIPICIMDGTLITSYRTAAAGAIAAQALARSNSKEVAIIGSGVQAKLQIQALSYFFNIETACVWSRHGVNEYIAYMSKLMPKVSFVEKDTVQDAVKQADIVITTTASKYPLIFKEWIKNGTHINAIGCDAIGKQELDSNVFIGAKIINDCTDECIKRGDTQHPINQKLITRNEIYAEIGEILLGVKDGRVFDEEITIFDSTGISALDITTSLYVYSKAKEKGIGQNISII